jgi:hypothetical protein
MRLLLRGSVFDFNVMDPCVVCTFVDIGDPITKDESKSSMKGVLTWMTSKSSPLVRREYLIHKSSNILSASST